ncbi:class I SAM-dependent methyltransferase [Blastopirellula marina]|uniref:Class I SAM-dependent methyltransferase n=1 Tax=Blastopirellula marina TaxID=124 RepID=A0A2S8GQF3_9BACT|nr:class I SAM-dependent methyltransferase [Blastopirellula marina]PQO46591.1 hypothetical protein C5Y93_08980 [Blastopirellula marina]
MVHRVFHAWNGNDGAIGTDVVATSPCPISGDRAAVVISNRDRYGYPLRTVISKASGLVYVDPRPTNEDLDDFYRHSYRRIYKSSQVPKWKHTARAAMIASQRAEKLVANVLKGASVLDIGTGSGELLYVGKKLGYQMQGLEVDESYAQFGRANYGARIWNTSLREAELAPESFDAITTFHVLEHLADPLAAMQKMARALKVGGVVLLEVPNVESLDSRFSQKWHPGHLFHFNLVTMAALANLSGLQPVVLATCGGRNHTEAMLIKPEQPPPVDWQSIVAGNFEQTWELLRYQAQWGWLDNWHKRIDRTRAKFARSVREWFSALSEPNRRRLVDKVLKKRA